MQSPTSGVAHSNAGLVQLIEEGQHNAVPYQQEVLSTLRTLRERYECLLLLQSPT